MKHPPRFNESAQRGYAMILVIIAVAVAFITGLTFLYTSTTTTGVSQIMHQHAHARQHAEASLDLTFRYMQQTVDWRMDREPGNWLTDFSMPGGSVTVDVDYDPSPAILSFTIDDFSFEDEVGALSNPLLNPPMTGTIGGWEVSRTALVETGLTVPRVGTEISGESTEGHAQFYVSFLVNVVGSATASQTFTDTLDPDSNYVLRVDVGRQELLHAIADIDMRIYADGILIACATDSSIFTAFNNASDPSIFSSLYLSPTHTECALRFTTDDSPPTGDVRIELHAESLVGVISTVTFDNLRFEKEQYSDVDIHVTGRHGDASHVIEVTASQRAPLKNVAVVTWDES